MVAIWKGKCPPVILVFEALTYYPSEQVPDGVTLAEAVTLPNNFVTAWHTLTMDLGFSFPWPKPDDYIPKDSDEAILIWGGASSVGQYAIQLLKYYGYTNIIAAASTKHHAKLQELGANVLFDYRNHDVVEKISNAGAPGGVKKILDCIGSVEGSIRPISKIAKKGANVAILLPVIVRDSSETEDPEYAMDVKTVVNWEEGVEPKGVRTHFYLEVSRGRRDR
jgi:D-arabinose 1-dehydrogenase-like Zn-dependent alcohol dehydrogenase